jgi:hypothetical protein
VNIESIKEIIQEIERLYLTKKDINNYGLITLKPIGRTKKEWSCNECNKTIEKGSSCARSFRTNGFGFDKLYWCGNCLKQTLKELNQVEELNISENAFDEAIGGMQGHGQD